MQSMQKWSYPKMEPSARCWCLERWWRGSSGYIECKDLGLWPCGSMICTLCWLDSPERLWALTNKNVDDTCNVMRTPGGKNADRTPNRGQQVSVKAQKKLKLATFLFHYRWRCTFNWEETWVHEDTVYLIAGQKNLKEKYKNPSMLQKINKSDTAWTMEDMKNISDHVMVF